MAPPQSKKVKFNAVTNPLGQILTNKTIIKDQSELDLEEAVFGKSASETSASIWDFDNDQDDNKFDQEDSEEEEETGLERLRDENVSLFCIFFFFFFLVSVLALAWRIL